MVAMWPRVFTALSAAALVAAPATTLDPFAFFRPSIAVSADDRRELDRGQSIARVVRGTDREVGVFGGLFGGLTRVFMERRLKKEASTVLLGLRQRLESGAPMASTRR